MGRIDTIAGEPAGGDSENAREEMTRAIRLYDEIQVNHIQSGTNVITFDEFEAPPPCKGQGTQHGPDVPLVVQMDIVEYEVAKVLIDTGSAANLIFTKTLEKMHLKQERMVEVTTPLIGFGGAVTHLKELSI